MKAKIKCPKCKSERVVKRGYSPTQNRGKQQRYLCRDCSKTFIPDLGFWKMKNNESKVTKAIDLYYSNLSSRKVRNTYKRHESTKISHVSILDWCRKYTLKVQKYVSQFTPTLSGQYYADETEIDRGKNNDIFWCSVDWGTRFINATYYSQFSQNKIDATTFMNTIKKSGTPRYIQTDYANWYPQPFLNTFNKSVEHRRNNVSQTGKHNVRIETVFSKIKDRVYDFRGLKALWSAPILLAGIVLQHNFIENHTTTGKLPCELARLKFDVGVDRWMGLIKIASK